MRAEDTVFIELHPAEPDHLIIEFIIEGQDDADPVAEHVDLSREEALHLFDCLASWRLGAVMTFEEWLDPWTIATGQQIGDPDGFRSYGIDPNRTLFTYPEFCRRAAMSTTGPIVTEAQNDNNQN